MSQVQTKNEGVRGATLVSEATVERASESTLPFAWMLNAGVEQRGDYRRPISVQFQNTSTVYSLGFSKQTSFGLTGKLAMTVTPFTFLNVAPQFASFLPFTSYFDVATTLEFTQSLWRNGFGRNTRAQQEVEQGRAMAAHFRNSYLVRQARQQAENAYWVAAGFQETLRIQRENLERAEKMKAWSKSKLELDLADRADLLQAESMLRVRELELAQANSDFKSACRQFNSLRGTDSDTIEEKLASVYIEDVDGLAPLARAKVRDDVAAAVLDAKVAYSEARLGAERNKPTLDAYMSYALTGRDATLSSSLNMMTQAIYPFAVFGVRFATPLHFGLLEDDKAAYLKEQKAA